MVWDAWMLPQLHQGSIGGAAAVNGFFSYHTSTKQGPQNELQKVDNLPTLKEAQTTDWDAVNTFKMPLRFQRW